MSSSIKVTHRQCLKVVCGIPVENGPYIKEKMIEEAMNYMPHDGDIVIASYPKTGTHWLQYTALLIISKGELYPPLRDTFQNICPFMTHAGTVVVDAMKPPRIYKYHFAYDKVQKNPKAKVLNIYRRPEDVCISLYHFMQELNKSEFEMEDFFEDFMSGYTLYGSYFDHLRSYFSREEDDNLLLISYEDMKKHPEEGVLRIADFLGQEYYQPLLKDPPLLKKILEKISFDYMKKNLSFDYSDVVQDDNRVAKVLDNFFRKGAVGEGMSLSEDKLERIKCKTESALKGTNGFKKLYN